MRTHPLLLIALLGAALLPACGGGEASDAGEAGAERSGPRPEYVREYVFLGSRAGEPLVVPFAFRARDAGGETERRLRAWLAHGPTWEGFLREEWRTPGTAGVWRVLPRGELRLAASGPDEVESLWFQRGERRLRLRIGTAVSGWVQGGNSRFRLLQGRLTLGEETLPGTVLQVLEVDYPLVAGRGGEPDDWLFLASGDSLRLVLSRMVAAENRFGSSFGWIGRPGGDRSWEAVEVDWMELRPLEEARRDIPLRWSFRVPEAGLRGEVEALGYETVVGEERAGRRAVEARYTVEGWVEVDGARSEVRGTVRHSAG